LAVVLAARANETVDQADQEAALGSKAQVPDFIMVARELRVKVMLAEREILRPLVLRLAVVAAALPL
jgi:hypothetical protein